MSDVAKILVVEDNDFVRMQICAYLKEAQFAVLEAREGDSALDLIQDDKDIALAIVDVRMEPMGGFDFITWLRSHSIATPVVLVTGDQTPDLLEQASRLGVASVLMKPVEKKRLIGTVERALAQVRRTT